MFVVLYTAACGPMGNRHRNSNITNAYTYTDAWMNATYTYATYHNCIRHMHIR